MPSRNSAEQLDEHPCIPSGHAPFAGKYVIDRVLGQGGMGLVVEARHVRVGQRVAIKVLGSALQDHPDLVERFAREARACGSLSSVHAVRVFDIDTTADGVPFMVMELLSGRDLATIIEHEGPQPVARAVRWVIEACDAIAEAHSLGIIHRDLKPSNLFVANVADRKIVKVLDFGIAKRLSTQETALTQEVSPLGTPQYMSPEHVRCAKDVDGRTDVWSLGITLYELVCGRTPFEHESASACIASIAADPVPDPRALVPDLPESFVAVLMKALEKNANDRYASVDELVFALAPFAHEEGAEDDAMASAVRRAFVLESALPRETQAPSEPELTAPPTVSRASLRPKRHATSRWAMAVGAVLGLAALVLTPRCVATSGGEAKATSTHLQSAPLAMVAATAEPAPIATATEAAPASAPPFLEPTRERASLASVRTAASRATSAKALKDAPARSGVHGGLSNPGF